MMEDETMAGKSETLKIRTDEGGWYHCDATTEYGTDALSCESHRRNEVVRFIAHHLSAPQRFVLGCAASWPTGISRSYAAGLPAMLLTSLHFGPGVVRCVPSGLGADVLREATP